MADDLYMLFAVTRNSAGNAIVMSRNGSGTNLDREKRLAKEAFERAGYPVEGDIETEHAVAASRAKKLAPTGKAASTDPDVVPVIDLDVAAK